METHPQIKLRKGQHRGKPVIFIEFAYDAALIQKVKAQAGSSWSMSKRCWYILEDQFNLNLFFTSLSEYAYIDYSSISGAPDVSPKLKKARVVKEKAKIPEAYTDYLIQKRYSASTQATYQNYFSDYMIFFKDRKLEDIDVDEINQYILGLIKKQKISASQQNQRINAIKFYYEKVLGREKLYFEIKRPKKTKALPTVLSIQEVKSLIDATSNLKHKCIISLLYSGGLRRSELCNLQIIDVLSDKMQLKIRNGKGYKDRYVNLSHFILGLLREYYPKYKPKKYLFEGSSEKPYSGESVLKVVKAASEKAGIKRRVTPHMLRHSFATHHLEKGTDIRYIQEFLGHNSSKTTEIYTHVANTDTNKFTNPLDEIYKTK